MKTKIIRIARKWGALIGSGLFVYLLSLYLFFPFDRLKDKLIAEAASAGVDLRVESAGPALGLGVSLDGVEIASNSKKLSAKPTVYKIDALTATVSPFAFLTGGVSVDVDATALGGTVAVALDRDAEETLLALNTEALSLAKVPGVTETINLPLSGLLDLAIEMQLPGDAIGKSDGEIKWKCKRCGIGDGKTKLKIASNPMLAEGMTFPRIRLGDFGGKISVDNGLGTLKGVHSKSKDMELFVEGEIRLAPQIKNSYLNLYLRFKVSEAFLKRADTLKTILDLLGGRGRRQDGYWGMRVTGQLAHLAAPQWSRKSQFRGRKPKKNSRKKIPDARRVKSSKASK